MCSTRVWLVVATITSRVKEEFEDTNGEIRIRISKKNRQHNDQNKKYKMTNNDQQNIHIKLKTGGEQRMKLAFAASPLIQTQQ